MLGPDDLAPADEKLLDLLREGRVTAPYAAEETDYSLQYVRDRLGRLIEHGHVVKIHQGLYELTNDPAEQADTPAETDTGADTGADDTRRSAPAETGETGDVRAVIREDAADEFPSPRDVDDCLDAIMAARDYLRNGSASMREIVTTVMPDHPLDYDVPDLEQGDRYRGAWWRKIVKPGLEAAPDVAYNRGDNKWYYTGDAED